MSIPPGVIPIPQLREGNLALILPSTYAALKKRDSSLPSVESHVIPAKAGIQIGEVDPRLRGGDDGLTFISMGGPQAHDHSE
jgi:hypothetical protein